MVFPIIGARDYIDQRGFIINECPTCGKPTVFSVYDTRRKLTLYFVPTLNVRSQMVMECMTCHGKWGIGDRQVESVEGRLMSLEDPGIIRVLRLFDFDQPIDIRPPV